MANNLPNSNPNNAKNNFGDTAASSSSPPPPPKTMHGVQVEGIHWPLEKDLEHHPEHPQTQMPPLQYPRLRFNGAGVRSIHFFGWEFKVYVAGFYHACGDRALLQSTDEVYEAVQRHPMQFDFTFLRTVPQSKVTEAWQRQLEHSVDYRYADYEHDRDTFIASFGPIVERGTVSVALYPCGRTLLIDQGSRRGVIESRNFQRAFLSMWFGTKAVHADLKDGLLGGQQQKQQQQQQFLYANQANQAVGMDGQYQAVG